MGGHKYEYSLVVQRKVINLIVDDNTLQADSDSNINATFDQQPRAYIWSNTLSF